MNKFNQNICRVLITICPPPERVMWDPPTGVICKDWIKAWLDSYLDQLILGPVLSITVFPMAMCLYEVRLLLPLSVLLDGPLLQLESRNVITNFAE